MDDMRDNYTVGELSEALAVSSSGYYKWLMEDKGSRQGENQVLLKEMKSIHNDRHMRCYGSPRMTRELNDRDLACSENRVARLMKAHDLAARSRRPFRPKTTQTNPASRPAPNRLGEIDAPKRPGEVFVSDITYVATRQGWLYLAVVIDLFSRTVVGWKMGESLATELVLGAVEGATARMSPLPGALFHSDRGCQYTSEAMRRCLNSLGFIQSMSALGYCYDNAVCESFFATLKNESFPENSVFDSKSQARLAIFDYLETFYNRRRKHSSLGYLSPENFLKNHFQKLNQNLN